MGASNVIGAYTRYAGKVPATSMQLLTYMAAVSKDEDAVPWYGQGHAALAEHALGRSTPIERADIKAVERAIAPLAAIGAISTDRRGSIRRDGNHTVRYRLHVKGKHVPRNPGGQDIDESFVDETSRPPKSGHDVPRNSSPRPPETVPTSPEKWGPEEEEEEEERENQEENSDSRTAVTATRAREAAQDPHFPSLQVVGGNPDAEPEPTRSLFPAAVPDEPPIGTLRGNGFCLPCHALGRGYVIAADPETGAQCHYHLRSAS